MEKIDLFEKYSARLDDICLPGMSPEEIALMKLDAGHKLNNRDRKALGDRVAKLEKERK